MKITQSTLKQWAQVILIGGSLITLAACSSGHKYGDSSAINDANAAYNSDAQTSGVGDESSFGDGVNGARSASSRTYYFDFDGASVRDSDKPAINANAKNLAAHSNLKVMLEGHTDPRGSREYNIGLGERRAKAVAEMLTSNGVDPDQIRVVSYGAEKLAASGHSESDYQLDRRVVLVYVK